MITEIDKNTALVIIDLQKGLTKMPLITPIDDLMNNTAKLVAAFRKANLPIVIVTVQPAINSKPKRTESTLRSGNGFSAEDLEVMPQIKTEPSDIFIRKHTWGAFHETKLDEELRKRDITGIVLAGIVTSIGVEGTARSASDYGYNITFAKDAMSDRSAEAHQHSLTTIFPRIGEVGDTDKIIEMITG